MTTVNEDIAREAIRASREGPSVAVATIVAAPPGAQFRPGEKLLVRGDGSRLGALANDALQQTIVDAALTALTRRPREEVETLYLNTEGQLASRTEAQATSVAVMLEVVERAATLLIVGGGHVGQAIASVAHTAGFSVVVLDDREAFANAERFPMADRVICGDFLTELQTFPVDDNTYVVMVSRGHKQDELALGQVASSNAAYVGMIGSIRRVGTVLTHLAREGLPRDGLARVHTPIGLDIGAETPEEIAVSVVAELILVRRGGTGQKLSEVRRARIRD